MAAVINPKSGKVQASLLPLAKHYGMDSPAEAVRLSRSALEDNPISSTKGRVPHPGSKDVSFRYG